MAKERPLTEPDNFDGEDTPPHQHEESENNLTDPDKFDEDMELDQTLRPTGFQDFPGQDKAKDELKLYVEAA
ncbi:uncharacterized protein METZ01_LOCUS415214, partial [marine metagenome]